MAGTAVTRLLDATPAELRGLRGRALAESIRLSEGRTVVAEVVAPALPLVHGVSNAELAAAFGADVVLLNLYDVTAPAVAGTAAATCADLQDLTGRLVGCNLEPIETMAPGVAPGRLATADNAKRARDLGARMIVVTANPRTGVTRAALVTRAVEIARAVAGDVLVCAGKMHAAGIPEPPLGAEDMTALAAAGVHGILIPAPGTVPGVTVDRAAALVDSAHRAGLLVLSAIGTSQEGAGERVIEQIALWSKMAGADLHHIGDAGYAGVAVPENIMALSIALRGRRHTWFRMACSLKR